MRYKPQHKEETRRSIVESAAKEFRTHGFDGVGIAGLMGALNLTHGGFYAHFADKETLVGEALVFAQNQNLKAMLDALKAGGVTALIDFYLGDVHLNNVAVGCPLPILTAEIARRSPASRDAFTAKLSEVFDAIAEYMPGTTQEQKRASVGFLFAAMAGAVSLARAVSDPEFSRVIVESTRHHLVTLFDAEPAQS